MPASLALAAVASCVLAVVGCSSSPAAQPSSSPTSGCRPIVANLIRLTQDYLDGITRDTQILPVASASPRPSPSRSTITEQQYSDAITKARQGLAGAGCDNASFQEAMQGGLQTVTSHGAVAGAVLRQLRAELRGDVPTTAVTRKLSPGDDLLTALAEIPPGSTVVLAAGSYRLPETLVVLRPVTIRGAGSSTTVLTSAAADAALILLTDKKVVLSGLAVRRVGAAAGSVVVTGPTAALSMHEVAVSGARSDGKGNGGVGVLLSSVGSTGADLRTSFTAVDSSFSDNASAGVAAGGTHQLVVTHSTFARDGQCGLCFLGFAAGTVRDTSFTGDSVGVVVASAADVTVAGNRFTGGDVGIQATGQSKPTVTGNVLQGTARASMVFVDTAAGRVDGNNCSGDRTGIAVAKSAYPYVGKNTCRVTLG